MKTNKMITGIIAGMSIFAFAAVSRAQVLPPVAPGVDGPIDPAGGALKRANGEVTSVDAKSGQLMIKTAPMSLTLMSRVLPRRAPWPILRWAIR